MRRGARAAVVAVGLAGGLSGALGACAGGSGPIAYRSGTLDTRVEFAALGVAQGIGMPMDDGSLPCLGPSKPVGFDTDPSSYQPDEVICQNTTTDTPTQSVTATFRPSGSTSYGSCPGTLTVSFDTTKLKPRRIDPCR